MTVSTEISREEYTGNGVTTDFDYRFRVFSADELVVSVADTTENISTLVLNTDYTVTGVGSRTGGKVKLVNPLANAWRISIERDLPVTQETDVRNQGNFFPEVHEDAWDKLTMLIQQVIGNLGLALRKPNWLAKYYDAKGNRITNLANPINGNDAANKTYVDAVGEANIGRTLRFPETYVPPMAGSGPRSNMLQGYNNLGMPVPIAGQTETADLAIKLSGSFGSQLVGHTDLISKFYFLKDYFDQGYILVSSRDELIAAQNVIKTVMLKRTEIRLSRNFAPWTAAQTDIDLAWVTITGHADGTYIDATGIPNVSGNYFIRFYNSGELNIKNLPFLEGLRFCGINVKGPGRTSLVDCLVFHSPGVSLGNLTVGNLNIQEFKRGMVFQTNAYIIKVLNSNITRCNVAGVDQPTGFSNYGENISLFGCTIGVSSGPAVHIQNGDGGFHLYGCSLDYTGQVIVSEGGYVECHGGHHEFGNSSNPPTGTPYIATNAQTARITLRGTKVVNIRSAGMTEQYLVRSDTAADGVYFLGALLQNTVTASGTLKSGDGRFVINDSQVQNGAGNHRLTVFQSEYENRMLDGGNEHENVLDWYVNRVNSAVTSRTTGDNITLSNSTEIPRSGGKSLKVTKSTAGTNHGVGFIVPVTAAQQPSFRFYVYPISGTTGSIFTDSYFVAVQGFDQYGRPNIIKQSASMGIRTTLLTGSSLWQSVVSYPSKTPVPSWATHIRVDINSSGLSVGGYYIDDAGIWQI
ncbi:hypothetical protein [Serratia liquefaciens]|uniref:hypothetical protein n=1 Tax=Serratia liquefaciens TaxID=614 RepID=UPI0021CA6660|nr:hypothetical protein [Serratia liquefaciens]